MKVTYPSPNAKRVVIGRHMPFASYKRGMGGLCNAETAIAVSIHKTSRVMFTALKVAAFLAVLGLAFYAYSQLPLMVIPNAN